MAGYPSDPSRAAFGPTLELGRALRNPIVELGPDPLNLMFNQVSSAGRMAPLLILSYTQADGVVYQRSTYDPLNADIAFVSTAAAVTFSIPASFPDENGTLIKPIPFGGMGSLSELSQSNGETLALETVYNFVDGVESLVSIGITNKSSTNLSDVRDFSFVVWGSTVAGLGGP